MVKPIHEPGKNMPNETSSFWTQSVRAWRPGVHPKWFLVSLLVLAVGFLALGGMWTIWEADKVFVQARYDQHCWNQKCAKILDGEDCDFRGPCSVTMHIEQDLVAPIKVYYRLTNFHQNHWRFSQSRNDRQLRGDGPFNVDGCAPFDKDGAGNAIFPCGIIAATMFNDTYGLCSTDANGNLGVAPRSCYRYQEDDKLPDIMKEYNWEEKSIRFVTAVNQHNSARWYIREKDITLPDDKSFRFASYDDFDVPYIPNEWTYIDAHDDGNSEGKPISLLNRVADEYEARWRLSEHFMNWMRPAATNDFKKLWGVIDEGTIPAGTTVEVVVDNQFDSWQYGGRKYIVLQNDDRGYHYIGKAFIIAGVLFLLMAVFFIMKTSKHPRRLGDPQLLVWRSNTKKKKIDY